MAVSAKKSKRKFIESVGRRKTAIARVRIYRGKDEVQINDKKLETYFQDIEGAPTKFRSILKKAGQEDKLDISILVKGGGKNSQFGAVLHGLARALIKKDEKLKSALKKEGLLTRDPRMKERKKYGLKGARRAPQFSKR